jgi:hypothetical protein
LDQIIVHLASATICFLGACHPALVGKATPAGSYDVTWRSVVSPGYGGDVLQFSEDAEGIYAIHRVWTLKPEQQRVLRLTKGAVSDRRNITGGCINVMPEVYRQLLDCCSRGRLTVED